MGEGCEMVCVKQGVSGEHELSGMRNGVKRTSHHGKVPFLGWP